jgi:Tfp pilus assembly protein PilF
LPGPTPFADSRRAAFFNQAGRLLALGLLLLGSQGCDTTQQERMHRFNDDGVFQFRQGAYGGARESFEAALKLKPDDSSILYNIGQCYDRQGDWPKAEKIYRQVLEKSEHHGDCRHALAVLLLHTGRKSEADQMIQDWLSREPKRAAAYAEDGWRLRQEHAYPQARARLEQALALDPRSLRALTELAILYEDMGLPERALVLYERALDIDPNQDEVLERYNQLKRKNVGRPLPN